MNEDALTCRHGLPPTFAESQSGPLVNFAVFAPQGLRQQLVLSGAETHGCRELWIDRTTRRVVLPLPSSRFGLIAEEDLKDAGFADLLDAPDGMRVIAWRLDESEESPASGPHPSGRGGGQYATP